MSVPPCRPRRYILVPDSRPETIRASVEASLARWYEELFPTLEALTIGYVAFSPLANGFLTARYGKEAKFEAGSDYRSVMPQRFCLYNGITSGKQIQDAVVGGRGCHGSRRAVRCRSGLVIR